MTRTPLVILGLAAALAAGVIVRLNRSPDAPPAEVPASTAAVSATTEATAPPPAAPEATPAVDAAAPDADAPTFDVVRVAPDGSAVVAGTAAPGAEVTVYGDAEALATAQADADGNFVAIFRAEPSREPRALSLGAEEPDGQTATSTETVVLLPKAPNEPATEPATRPDPAAGPARPAGTDTHAAATPGEPDATAEMAPEATAPEIAATAIVRTDGVEAASVAPSPDGRVTLAAISYADAGDVTLSGAGTGGARLRAYVDGRLTEEATVDPEGRWTMALNEVAAGLYTLRIDQLDANGSVASRVETPFQRDYPRAPTPRPGVAAVPTGGTGILTVQPGNNLWTLAQTHYGSGTLYTQIFTANRELIRDPDLIYPGQVLEVPEFDGSQ